MCKVLMFSNGSKIVKRSTLRNLIKVAHESITHYDNDGFGWLAWGKHGAFGERTNDIDGYIPSLSTFKSRIDGLPFITPVRNNFGVVDTISGPIMFHGRTSTNSKSLINTHPIKRNGWYIIHNGVVTNHGPKYDKLTQNDTEDIVHYLSTDGIDGVEKNLSGYYAVGAVDPQGALHVFKDDVAQLYVSYVTTIDSYVYATTSDLIDDVCTAMKWKYEPCQRFRDNTYVVLRNNIIVSNQTIKPRGMSTQYERSMMGTSLHYLEGSDYDFDAKSWRDTANEYSGVAAIDKVSSTRSSGGNDSKSTPKDLYSLTPNELSQAIEEMEILAEEFSLLDKHEHEIDVDHFRHMETSDKIECTVRSPMGEYYDIYDVASGRVYDSHYFRYGS